MVLQVSESAGKDEDKGRRRDGRRENSGDRRIIDCETAISSCSSRMNTHGFCTRGSGVKV